MPEDTDRHATKTRKWTEMFRNDFIDAFKLFCAKNYVYLLRLIGTVTYFKLSLLLFTIFARPCSFTIISRLCSASLRKGARDHV